MTKSTDSTRDNAPVPLERYQYLERAIQDTPLNVDPYLELAEIYTNAARWSDAKRVLEKAVQRFPDDARACYQHEEAQLARARELNSIAESAFRDYSSDSARETLERSQIELSVLQVKIYRQRLQRHPEDVDLILPLADALESFGEHQEAIELLQQAGQIARLRAPASLRLGKLLARLGKVPEALSAYRQAAFYRVPPPDERIKIEALQSAADLAERNHMIDSARRYVEMLMEIQPSNTSLRQRCETLRNTPL